MDWDLNRWSTEIKFEIKFYRGLLMAGKKDEYLCFCHLEAKSRNIIIVKLLYLQLALDKPSHFPSIIKTFSDHIKELSTEQQFEIYDESIHKFLQVKTVTKDHRTFSSYHIQCN